MQPKFNLTDLNTDFPSSYHTKVQKLSQPYYLPVTKEKGWIYAFPQGINAK